VVPLPLPVAAVASAGCAPGVHGDLVILLIGAALAVGLLR